MPGRLGLQLPDNASPDCTSVQWMAETLPLKVLSSVQLPEKSAAAASTGTSATAAMKYAGFMDALFPPVKATAEVTDDGSRCAIARQAALIRSATGAL